MKIQRMNAPRLILLVACMGSAATAQDRPTDEELFAGADARIEQFRQADATVTVLDAAGQPVEAGARYYFEPGCGLVLWQGGHGEPPLFSGEDLLAIARGEYDGSARLPARRLLREVLVTGSSPTAIRARIAVGAV